MKLKTWQKNVLSAIVIVGGGYLLFFVAFLLAAVTLNGCQMLVEWFTGHESSGVGWMTYRYVFLAILLLISWLVFRSKLPTLVKAAYLPMPLMVLLVLTGIRFYQQSKWVPIGVGAVLILAVLLYLYKRKLPWQYYFATLYTAIMALYVLLSGMEI